MVAAVLALHIASSSVAMVLTKLDKRTVHFEKLLNDPLCIALNYYRFLSFLFLSLDKQLRKLKRLGIPFPFWPHIRNLRFTKTNHDLITGSVLLICCTSRFIELILLPLPLYVNDTTIVSKMVPFKNVFTLNIFILLSIRVLHKLYAIYFYSELGHIFSTVYVCHLKHNRLL